MSEILLTSINDAIDRIEFKRHSYYNKAKQLTQAIFTSFMNDKNGVNFTQPKEFSNSFLKTIIKRNEDRAIIIKELKNAEIIITDNRYFTGTNSTTTADYQYEFIKPFAKSYVINTGLIYNQNIGFSQFNGINKKEDRVKFKRLKNNLDLIKIDDRVYTFIPNLVEEQLSRIQFGSQITNKMIKIKIGKEEEIQHISYWLSYANRKNMALIKLSNKFYIESLSAFIARKKIELEITYLHAIERIKNGNYYANRNTTNNRLDYNLTGLKKELFDYVILDGEKTVEIDIKNAQFAILGNLDQFKLDEIFIEKTQSGEFYEYIMEQLSITRPEAKQYMMIVAFGEAKYHPENLITLFPETMNSIKNFKDINGFKKFSIELQKAESNLMIDGIFEMLTNNNIKVLPIHDSMRVKVSDAIKAKQMMEDFFIEKNFKCKLSKKK